MRDVAGTGPRGGFREGLRYVARERTTRAFLLMGWVLPLLIIPNFAALPPIYAKDIFGGGPGMLGALIGFAVSTSLPVALVLLAVAGFWEMIYLTTDQTLLQLSIPDELRGRVTGIVSLNAALAPVGALIVGAGADLVGPRMITIILSGIAAGVAVVVAIASPTIREYRLSRALGR